MTIFQVQRVKPSRLDCSVDIYIDDIISGCSSDFARKSHPRELFQNSYGTFVLVHHIHHLNSITFTTFWLQFLLLFQKVHLFRDQIATHSLKLPYLPHTFCSRFYFLITLVYVFCVLYAYSCPVLSSYLLWFASLPPLQRFEIVRRLPTNKSFW